MTIHPKVPVSRLIAIHEVAWENAGPGLKAKPLWVDPATSTVWHCSGTLSGLAGLSAGGELAGEVDRWRPRVVARARCCWRVLG